MYNELEPSNITPQLGQNTASDPNVNYDILVNNIAVTMSKHIPLKKI